MNRCLYTYNLYIDTITINTDAAAVGGSRCVYTPRHCVRYVMLRTQVDCYCYDDTSRDGNIVVAHVYSAQEVHADTPTWVRRGIGAGRAATTTTPLRRARSNGGTRQGRGRFSLSRQRSYFRRQDRQNTVWPSDSRTVHQCFLMFYARGTYLNVRFLSWNPYFIVSIVLIVFAIF